MVENGVIDEVRKDPGKLLAAFNIKPFVEMYPESKVEELREKLEIESIQPCTRALIAAFILDVLFPPPLRPPLAFISCWSTGVCP